MKSTQIGKTIVKNKIQSFDTETSREEEYEKMAKNDFEAVFLGYEVWIKNVKKSHFIETDTGKQTWILAYDITI